MKSSPPSGCRRLDDEEKAARTAQIQEALRSATEVPLEVMRACAEAIQAAADVAAFGNANASSDVQVGLELLMAALRGAEAECRDQPDEH